MMESSSWKVAASSFIINMLTFGILRASVTETAKLHRATMALRSFSSPLAGYFASHFGVRYVTTFGHILAFIGLFACCLGYDIAIIRNGLWSIAFGLGMGFGNTLLSAIINQTFDKHRAKATCVFGFGSSFGFLILTLLVNAMLSAYEVPGTYLLLSALLLNCFPATFFLKTPRSSSDKRINSIAIRSKVRFYAGEEISNKSRSSTSEDIPSNSLILPKIEIEGLSGSSSEISYKVKDFSTQTLLSNYFVRMSCSDAFSIGDIKNDGVEIASSRNADFIRKYVAMNLKNERCRFASVQCERPLLTKPPIDSRKYSLKSSASDSGQGFFGRHLNLEDKRFHEQASSSSLRNDSSFSQKDESFYDSYPVQDIFQDTNNMELGSNHCEMESIDAETKPNRNLRSVSLSNNFLSKKILFHPIFILVTVSNAVSIFTSVWIVEVIASLPSGTNFLPKQYIYFIRPGAEMLGYLTHGFVIDGGLLTMTTFSAATFFWNGLAVILLPWFQNTTVTVTLISLTGFLEAGIQMVLPVMIGDYLEERKQVVAVPFSLILSGPVLLLLFFVDGNFYEDFGSRKYVFSGVGILSILCSLMWLLATKLFNFRKQN